MKTYLHKLIALGAVLFGAATFASATPINGTISLLGGDSYSSTSVTFTGTASVFPGTTSGTLGSFDSLATVTMSNFVFSPFIPGTQIFKVVENGNTLNLNLQSISSVDTSGGNLTITGIGLLSENGFTSTNSNFSLSTQGGTGNNVTFSATAVAPTPEPSTLLLLGTGLLGSATTLYRRRRSS